MTDIVCEHDGDNGWMEMVTSLENLVTKVGQVAVKESCDPHMGFFKMPGPKSDWMNVDWLVKDDYTYIGPPVMDLVSESEKQRAEIMAQCWSCECDDCLLWENTRDWLEERLDCKGPFESDTLCKGGFCDNNVERMLKQQKSFINHKLFIDTPQFRLWMNLDKLVTDEIDHDSKPKEGSFCTYGNEQLDQYTLTRPSIINVNGLFICSSTCLLPSPVNVTGTGATNVDAFMDWTTQINVYIDKWEPVDMAPATLLVRYLKTLNIPRDHPFYSIVNGPVEAENVKTFWTTFMEGGFNKYGNGQPALSKKKWMALNSKRLASLTQAQRETQYHKYVKKFVQVKPTIRKVIPKTVKPTPYNKRSTGLDMSTTNLKLSGCAKGYATALRCPFWFKDKSCNMKVASLKVNPEMNPCIPSVPNVKSKKVYYSVAGTFGCSAGSESAFIAFSPNRLANDNSTVFDVSCPVLYSKSAVGGTLNVFPTMDTGAAWNNGATSLNTDYNTAGLVNVGGVGVKYRVVAAGLRVKYSGNILNASGIYACVEHTDHQSLSNLTLQAISQMDSYFSVSVVSKLEDKDPWTYLTYSPVTLDGFNYAADTIANATWPTHLDENHYMGILVSGLPTGGDYFEFEAIAHLEIIGQKISGKTDTPADPLGTAAVLNTISPEKQKLNNTSETLKTGLTEGAADMSLSGLAKTAMNVVEKVALPGLMNGLL